MLKTHYFYSFHSSQGDTHNNEKSHLKKIPKETLHRNSDLDTGLEMFLKDNLILWLCHKKEVLRLSKVCLDSAQGGESRRSEPVKTP